MSDCCQKRHIAIVGSGSGAFSAAIKAVEGGARVTMIEAGEVIGGTCVNIGCVPSKIMIRGAAIAQLQREHHFDGVPVNPSMGSAEIDRGAMVEQQQAWVNKLRYAKYESILASHPDIHLLSGQAAFRDAETLVVIDQNGEETLVKADRFLLAVGARAHIPDIKGLASTPYWTSTEALIAETLPEHLVVLGGSVVALEMAQAFRHLGVPVTLLARSTLLSKEDAELGEALQTVMRDEGMDIRLHTVPQSISHDGRQFRIHTQQDDIECDQLLVATGRRSNADTLALHHAGVEITRKGAIIVDQYMRTNIETIFAVGDCTSQPQYVYVAAAAGTRAARNMMGEQVELDLSVLPAVVFTEPQVGTVGLNEQQAAQQGLQVTARKLELENVPRALANMDTRGFIKLVAESESGRLLGCQILAHEAGEVIQTAALAIQNKMTVEQLANQLFPYLTMVEGLKLTAQTFFKDVKQLSCCAG